MYSYTKKKKFPKRKMIVGLSALLVVAVAFLSYEYTLNKEKDTAVTAKYGFFFAIREYLFLSSATAMT